ncbi:MAG: hypothetical protein QOH56_2433 [Pseudonocardiales bacterium]|jgi:hypothetical protein|nr:hypothetical protein [Pseudonocardiales bacterium]
MTYTHSRWREAEQRIGAVIGTATLTTTFYHVLTRGGSTYLVELGVDRTARSRP